MKRSDADHPRVTGKDDRSRLADYTPPRRLVVGTSSRIIRGAYSYAWSDRGKDFYSYGE